MSPTTSVAAALAEPIPETVPDPARTSSTIPWLEATETGAGMNAASSLLPESAAATEAAKTEPPESPAMAKRTESDRADRVMR